jgi:UDP-glucose 4-epimerase
MKAQVKKIGIIGSSGFISKSFQHYFRLSNLELFTTYDQIRKYPSLHDISIIFILNGRLKQSDEGNLVNYKYNYDKEDFENYIKILKASSFSGKLVFLSSASALYKDDESCKTEDSALAPVSNYGKQKLYFEELLINSGISYYILRLTNVYGYEKRKNRNYGVINIWINDIWEKGYIDLYSDIDSRRDYLYIDDLLKLFSLIIEGADNNSNEIYNVSYGKCYSLAEIIKILKSDFEDLGINNFEIKHSSKLINQPFTVSVNSMKVRSDFHWEPTVNIDRGIRTIVSQFMKEVCARRDLNP